MIRHAAPLAVLLLAACAATPEARQADGGSLAILHVNDHHSHLAGQSFAFDVSGLELESGAQSVTVEYGGMPRLTTLFAERGRAHDNVLKLHAGDAITGTLYYTGFEGEADAAMMGGICFDAFAIGNHEFDHGDQGLAGFLAALEATGCGTEILGANIHPAPGSPIAGMIAPSAVFERGGHRYGVIGLVIADKTAASSSPDPGTTFSDERETAQAEIDRLRAEGVDRIIVLSHYQYGREVALAEALSGVDVVVGGDSHTLLGGAGLERLGFQPDGPYPTVVENADGDIACVVQAWEFSRVMGELVVSFDARGRVTACEGLPLVPVQADRFTWTREGETLDLSPADTERVRAALARIDEARPTAPDPRAQALLAGYDAELRELTETVIGQASENLCLARVPGDSRAAPLCDPSETFAQGSHVSNIVARAFLMGEPSADVAIQNAGGVRAGIAAGPVTIADVHTVLPFANTMTILTMTGAEIEMALEDAVAHDPAGGGSYPYAAGLRFSVDASAPEGARISDVEINPRLSGDWSPLDRERDYRVVTNSFIASGSDGYATFGRVSADGRAEAMYSEYAQTFIDHVRDLTDRGEGLSRPGPEEMSTRAYISADGCDHSAGGC
jgi:5'-nucleotidase/UDP-sugar diphosphatase